jgi:voltage-gated potassium channel
VLKPAVVNFLELATQSGNLELQIEEIRVKDDPHIIDRSLEECGIRNELGVIIVAIKRASGEMEFNPTPTSIIRRGDTLIAMGEMKQLRELEKLIGE